MMDDGDKVKMPNLNQFQNHLYVDVCNGLEWTCFGVCLV